MIYIVKMNNNLVVTSEDKYAFPYGEGQVTYPINSLAYVIDESNIVTFRSAFNNDVLFTGHLGKIMIEGTIVDRSNFSELFDSIAFGSTGGGEGGGSGINEAMLKAKGYMRGVTLTQNEYDELSDKEGNVLYNVSDAPDPLASFVEVVDELPTENISDKKIYFLRTPAEDIEYTANVSMQASTGAWTEFVRTKNDRYKPNENYTTDYYNGTIEVDTSAMEVITNNRWRVNFSGITEFELGIGLRDISTMNFGQKVYIGVGALNQDLSVRPENDSDYYFIHRGAGETDNITYSTIMITDLDPSKSYFVDIWSNGGVAETPIGTMYAQPYIAWPVVNGQITTVRNPNQFKEYAWIDNNWEIVGEDDKSNYLTKSEANSTFVTNSTFTPWVTIIRANERNVNTLSGNVETINSTIEEITNDIETLENDIATLEEADRTFDMDIDALGQRVGALESATPSEWIGTQAEYDALTEKDENTTYYITEE